jgi:hypothetical protein
MNTRQEHGEPERGEGLGGRVRRFVDNELSRVLDKGDKGDHKGERETDRGGTDYRRESDQIPEFDRPQEPVTPHANAPGRVSQPVTATPVESGYHTPGYDTPGYEPPAYNAPVADAPAHGPRAEEAGPGQFQGHPSGEAGADSRAERVGLLNDPAGLRDQWQRVQGTFVDDPQRAVQEASVLVNRTLQEIRENVTRSQASDPTSTEDLRVSFQRYREFFQRLLSA